MTPAEPDGYCAKCGKPLLPEMNVRWASGGYVHFACAEPATVVLCGFTHVLPDYSPGFLALMGAPPSPTGTVYVTGTYTADMKALHGHDRDAALRACAGFN